MQRQLVLLLLGIKECLNSAENFDELLCKDHHDTKKIETVILYVQKVSIEFQFCPKKYTLETNFLDKDKKENRH